MRIIRQTLHQVTVCLQRLDKFLFLSALALIMQLNVISDTAETPTEYENLLLRIYWAEQSSFVNRFFDIFTVIKREKIAKNNCSHILISLYVDKEMADNKATTRIYG